MDSINFAQFDIRGTRPENRILNEKIPIKDKTCPWVIPNGSPFFGEAPLTKLYDARGAELTLGRDYWFEGEFGPFCELSGRSICSFIKLSQAVRNTSAFVTVTYQSIGAWFFPRNNLEDWVKEMTQGNVPIPWSKVFGVPPELPASFHSHSAVTEIGDWFELGFFFNYMAGIYKTRNPNTPNLANQVITDGFAQLKAVKTQQLQRLVSHDGDYNKPHNPTKEQLGLEKLDNFATAKLSDQLAGVSNTLFSTVLGVKELSKFYKRPTPDLMRPGIIPISRYGTWKFLPPLIKGSYEGLGSETCAAAICLESDDTLSVLGNHYDGRTRGLYFSKVEGYNTPDPKHTFTGHRYAPPALASTGLVLNRVVPGSGPKAILVGQHGTGNWFIGLTNGTLDPRAHALVQCDMTTVANVLNDPSKPSYSLSDLGTVHRMGDYIVLVHTDVGNAPSRSPRHTFFRVKVVDILAGNKVVWEAFNVTYTTYDGELLTDQASMVVASTITTDGKMTRLGPFTVTPEMTEVSFPNKVLSLSSPKAGMPGIYNFTLLTWCHLSYVVGSDNLSARCVMETTYNFNPSTGVLTSKAKTPAFSYDFLATPPEQYQRYLPFVASLNGGKGSSSVLLDNGELISVIQGPNKPPHPVQVITKKFTGRSSGETLLGTLLDATQITQQYSVTVNETRESPLLSGMFPAGVVYDMEGEVFDAVNQGTLARELFYRPVTGAYQVRPTVKNLLAGDVLARPLSDVVYSTNLERHDSMISLTGSASELTTAGVECGSASLAVCAYSSTEGFAKALPTNAALRAPVNNGGVLSFPRTFTKTVNEAQKKVTYAGETFYGLSQAVLDQLSAKVPLPSVGQPEWAFTLHVLGDEVGGVFGQLNLALVQLSWREPDTNLVRVKLILATPTVEEPNVDHPDTYLITELQVLHEPLAVKANALPMARGGGVYGQFLSYKDIRFSVERPLMSGYRDGSRLKVFVVGGHFVNTGYSTPLCNLFDINLITQQIENIASGTNKLGWGDYVAMIPKVGVSDYSTEVVSHPDAPDDVYLIPPPEGFFTSSGGAAGIAKKTVGGVVSNYLMASVYPQSGWVLQFMEDAEFMINGTLYTLPAGTIDLRDVIADPKNRTFYLYATVEGILPKYVVSTTKLRKRSALLPIGMFTTNDTQILTIKRAQPLMVGEYLLSHEREGGIIPVSSGVPQDDGMFKLIKSGELLP